MYIDRTGAPFTHNHGPHIGGVAGCPECKARNRDSRFRRTKELGLVKDHGRNARLAEMSSEDRLAYKRTKQNAANAKYRAKYGRPHDHRYPGKNTVPLRDHWIARGINPDVCFYCSAPAEHADHFHPRARGGSDEYSNLVPACAPCNHSKNDMMPIDWLNKLLKELA